MSKILVDVMPQKPEECPFAEYIHMISRHECRLKSSLYSPHTQNLCDLECGKECEKLVDNTFERTFELQIDDNQFKDMMHSLQKARLIFDNRKRGYKNEM